MKHWTCSQFSPNYRFNGTFKATPIAEQLNCEQSADGETKSICSHFCLINTSASDDTIHL